MQDMKASAGKRIQSIDLLRGVVILLMALDHVRMYFGYGTWNAEPTNLAATTPQLFLTRWITHFCAPVFVFLSGTSAYLFAIKKSNTKETSRFLLTRGLWLIVSELVIVNFAWTFDKSYSFRILQVIWAIGISMIALSVLVYLPNKFILGVGIIIVFAHNLLDGINVNGNSFIDLLWYTLLQPKFLILDSGNIINFVYPVLPWIGLMALGYVTGAFYTLDYDPIKRRQWLLWIGTSATILFIFLRGFNLYGETKSWSDQSSSIYSVLSILNTSKYPPSLQFLLMTMGPALIFLSNGETVRNRISVLLTTFGKVPFFFYIVHLYFIHTLAALYLVLEGHTWDEYILTAREMMSGGLGNFGVGLEMVYLIWIMVIVVLYPLCKWYKGYKESHPEKQWLSYL
jgi:uncharacterized membrane protein